MNYLFVSIVVVALIAGALIGYLLPRDKPKVDGYLEVTQDSKSIFTFDPTIEPEELALREYINIKVVRRGPSIS